MNDLQRLLDAVTEMRAAQKLEWAALPSNFRLWKRARQQMNVTRLEEQVDQLTAELLRSQNRADAGEADAASAEKRPAD